MRLIALVVVASLCTGCVHSNRLSELSPVPQGTGEEHPLYRAHTLQYLSCDFESGMVDDLHPPPRVDSTSRALNLSAWHLQKASRAWPYALMSSNVYREGPIFRIPGWEAASRWESPSGLALEEWHRKKGTGEIEEIAVVFKGTDFTSLADWRTNLSVIEPRQHREAYAYMLGVMQRAQAQGSRVIATGHSLGGALALNMSLRLPNVDFIGFNPSPRAFYDVVHSGPAERLIMHERGEILGFLRWPWMPRLKNFTRARYDFMDFIFGRSVTSFKEHSMYLFSRGLLLAAIRGGDKEAGRAFTANFPHRQVEQTFGAGASDGTSAYDQAYCQRIFEGRF